MNDKSDVLAGANLKQRDRGGRRSFLAHFGALGLGSAATAALSSPARAANHQFDNQSGDTAQQIFTAALIAEDLATTFYYNALNGAVIMDPNLAGTGGSATSVAADGNPGNVQYLQAALIEEITHANLLR